jgi:hypothetical protein
MPLSFIDFVREDALEQLNATPSVQAMLALDEQRRVAAAASGVPIAEDGINGTAAVTVDASARHNSLMHAATAWFATTFRVGGGPARGAVPLDEAAASGATAAVTPGFLSPAAGSHAGSNGFSAGASIELTPQRGSKTAGAVAGAGRVSAIAEGASAWDAEAGVTSYNAINPLMDGAALNGGGRYTAAAPGPAAASAAVHKPPGFQRRSGHEYGTAGPWSSAEDPLNAVSTSASAATASLSSVTPSGGAAALHGHSNGVGVANGYGLASIGSSHSAGPSAAASATVTATGLGGVAAISHALFSGGRPAVSQLAASHAGPFAGEPPGAAGSRVVYRQPSSYATYAFQQRLKADMAREAEERAAAIAAKEAALRAAVAARHLHVSSHANGFAPL